MKIIETRSAPNPRRVRIFLAEKGLEIPYEEMPLTVETINAPRFRALNPVGRVPILVLDDGTAISESMAICRYFEIIQPDPPLFGVGALGQAMVEMWNRRVEHHLLLHVAQAFRHLHPRMASREVPQFADWGESNKPKAQEQLILLDRALADRPFLAGDDYSVADITLLVAVDFAKDARIEWPETLDNLASWHARVSARPSAAA